MNTRNYLIIMLERSSPNGLMSTVELAAALRCSRTKAREYTCGLPKYVGNKYLIPDIVDSIIAREGYDQI